MRVRSRSRPCGLADIRLCGSISRRSKFNGHTGRDEAWDIQKGHRPTRVHQGYKLARRSLRFESPAIHLCPFIDARLFLESLPTLYPLPSFSPPRKLLQAKTALSFAVHSSVHNAPRVQSPDSTGSPPSGGFSGEAEAGPIPIPTMVTTLVVGCRRKVVVYRWRDGDAQEVKVSRSVHKVMFGSLIPLLSLFSMMTGNTTSTLSSRNSVLGSFVHMLRILSN